MYDLGSKSPARIAFPFDKHRAGYKMQRGTSLEHILKEITNFGKLEAETQASITGLAGLENRLAKSKSVDALNTNSHAKNHKNNKFKDLLVNDNLVIIDKTPDNDQKDTRPEAEAESESDQKQHGDLPVPNTVRRCKDIFETLSNKPSKTKTIVGRSVSVRVTSADWKRAVGAGVTAAHEERCRTLPGRLAMPPQAEHGVEEARDWLNACSPVSPDVIQKLRERGTSMSFFGRPAYTPSPSPVSDASFGDWKKPRIIGITRKVRKGANKAPSSLGSSSTCSDEELHFGGPFDFPSSEHELRRRRDVDDAEEVDEVDSGHEDYHSYDVVFLDATYVRSNTPQLGFVNKGVWLRDPFWSGSSYIVYDFRGSSVRPHVKQQ